MKLTEMTTSIQRIFRSAESYISRVRFAKEVEEKDRWES